MKQLGAAILLSAIALTSASAFAIVHGRDATGSEPFAKSVVGLGRKTADGYHIFCTASLLNSNTVVTAAHCMYMRDNNDPRDGDVYVLFGLNEKNPEIQARRMALKAVHERYVPAHKNDERDEFDIALVRFEGEAPAGYFALPLLPDESALYEGETVVLAGYGYTDTPTETGNGTLRYCRVQVQDSHSAKTEITTDEKNAGSSNIDSGGPGFIELDHKFFLWGITSRPGGADQGIYTKATSYKDWLDKKISELNPAPRLP